MSIEATRDALRSRLGIDYICAHCVVCSQMGYIRDSELGVIYCCGCEKHGKKGVPAGTPHYEEAQL